MARDSRRKKWLNLSADTKNGKNFRKKVIPTTSALWLSYEMAQTPIERTSIVEQVKLALLKELKSGRLHRNERVLPIRTLASHLGSSRDAVWRALNELVKDGWLLAMQNRGYRIAPNWADKLGDDLQIAILAEGYEGIRWPMLQWIYFRLQEQAERSGITLRLNLVPDLSSKTFPDLKNPDGIIVLGCLLDVIHEQYPKTPLVGINAIGGRLPRNLVITDHFLGGQLAARAMVAQGYQKMGIISYHSRDQELGNTNIALRVLGFQKEWLESGLPLQDVKVFYADVSTQMSRLKTIDEISREAKDFDGFFCVTDQFACDLLECLEGQGISVPGDIGVMGYDGNLEAGPMFRLSTIRQRAEVLAMEALVRLRQIIVGEYPEFAPVHVAPEILHRTTLPKPLPASEADTLAIMPP